MGKEPEKKKDFVVQLLSRVRLIVTPWIAARQAPLPITSSRSLPASRTERTHFRFFSFFIIEFFFKFNFHFMLEYS